MAARAHSGVTYHELHVFSGSPGDGAKPVASLIDVNGTLYGTTANGGTYNQGTVFAITLSGTLTVLHNFSGAPDGAGPYARLTNVNGILYGTTVGGGAHVRGTVFAITTSGAETVLHSFEGYPGDGDSPVSDLINVDGTLYGTTFYGGFSHCLSCGTVYSITKSGKETVLDSFSGSNGENPAAGLTDVNGKLYGTTEGGGTYNSGTVFSITRSGKEAVLHSFIAEGDGKYPYGDDLIYLKGALYGTTSEGGATDYGTFFTITPSGKETVLHSFGATGDGRFPEGEIVNINDTIYGTTFAGGDNDSGTAFSMTTGGSESVLYSFRGFEDPAGGLSNLNGTLYGTTSLGGTYGDGTVFALTP